MASLSGVFNVREFTSAGLLAAGYRLYTYVGGTTTHKLAYTNSAATVPHTYTADGLGGQYIALNARGELPGALYLTSGPYDLALKTPAGVTVRTSRAQAIIDEDSVAAVATPIAAAAVADLALDLATTGDANAGAGLVAFSGSTAYALSTLGGALQSLCINVKTRGALGNSNGTTGSGADDTAALQAAITLANATGRRIFLPAGIYRITAPLVFSGLQHKVTFEGESTFDAVIFADFASATKVAALTVSNTSPRAYVAFRNFRVMGRSLANVSGIYANNAGEFTEFENVWVLFCENGIVVSNDYNVKLTKCQTWYNTNNGIQIGYTIAGVIGACNNILLLGCLSTYNTASGFYVYGARTLGMVQCDAEANGYTNIFLDTCFGVSLTGIYMEYASSEAGNPEAQMWIKACIGVSVDGVSVSAFDNSGKPVFLVTNDSVGVAFKALAIETAGSPTSAIGLSVNTSYGVSLSASYFNAMSTGLYMTGSARVSIEETDFSNCTTPVSSDNTGTKYLVWEDAPTAQLAASLSQISINTAVDATTITGAKNRIGELRTVSVVVASSDLASAGSRALIAAQFASETWRIVDIRVLGTVAFTGGGGNRLLSITDGSATYSAIPAASLATANLQARWGAADVPYPATPAHQTQLTAAGASLVARYSGGTTDYSSGSITVTITAQRVA